MGLFVGHTRLKISCFDGWLSIDVPCRANRKSRSSTIGSSKIEEFAAKCSLAPHSNFCAIKADQSRKTPTPGNSQNDGFTWNSYLVWDTLFVISTHNLRL